MDKFFDQLNLHNDILKAVETEGYTEPTDIQKQAIPLVIEGQDLLASAQTGTGKTAAFLLPILNKIVTGERTGGPRALVLAPTRELALQIETQAKKYSRYLRAFKTVCVLGGAPMSVQMRKLSKPFDLLIATPGRLIDFMDRKKVDITGIEVLVLDEADRMLDMGFIDPVKKIAAKTPSDRQTLLFSATMPKSVIKLAEHLLRDPTEVKIHHQHDKNENIQQNLHYADDLGHKNRLLDHILNEKSLSNAIVFTSTKRHASKLLRELQDKGYQTGAMHGDMSQRQRTRTITELKNGKINILVATDVAARGIDVKSITHVINFDMPQSVEDYVHRIGRTGRAGAKGTALSFVTRGESYFIKKIEKYTGQIIDPLVITGLEPKAPKKNQNSEPRNFRQRRPFGKKPGGPSNGQNKRFTKRRHGR